MSCAESREQVARRLTLNHSLPTTASAGNRQRLPARASARHRANDEDRGAGTVTSIVFRRIKVHHTIHHIEAFFTAKVAVTSTLQHTVLRTHTHSRLYCCAAWAVSDAGQSTVVAATSRMSRPGSELPSMRSFFGDFRRWRLK